MARTLSKSDQGKDEMEGGTLSYMPPEALVSLDYKPSKAFDIYRYQNHKIKHAYPRLYSDECALTSISHYTSDSHEILVSKFITLITCIHYKQGLV